MGAGGVLIGTRLGVEADYVGQVLPGWLVIGAGVGFALPTLVGAASRGLAPHQTSTGSAIVQMGRQIGSVLGVALLVVILGSTVSRQHAVTAWWWAGGFALIAVVTAIPISAVSRRRLVTQVA